MDIPAANGVRQPALQSDSTDPGWRPIIPHAEEDAAALEIHPRRNLFRPLPRADIIVLECDPRILPFGNQLQKTGPVRPSNDPQRRGSTNVSVPRGIQPV